MISGFEKNIKEKQFKIYNSKFIVSLACIYYYNNYDEINLSCKMNFSRYSEDNKKAKAK